MRVAVVGAGVIGVTSAFAVKSSFPSYDVKIFATHSHLTPLATEVRVYVIPFFSVTRLPRT